METVKDSLKVSPFMALVSFLLGLMFAYGSVKFTIILFESFGTTPEEKELYTLIGFATGVFQYVVLSVGLLRISAKDYLAGGYYFVFALVLLLLSIIATLGFQTVTDNKKADLAWKNSPEYQRLSKIYTNKMDSIAEMKRDKESWNKDRYRTKRQEIQVRIKIAETEASALSDRMANPSRGSEKNTSKAATGHLARILGLANKDLNFWYQVALAFIIELCAAAAFAISKVVTWRPITFIVSVFGLHQWKNNVVEKIKNRNNDDFINRSNVSENRVDPSYMLQPVFDKNNMKQHVTAENILDEKDNDWPEQPANDNIDVTEFETRNRNVSEAAINENVFKKKTRNSKLKVLTYKEVKDLILDNDVKLTPGCRPIMRVAGVGYPVAKQYMARLLKEDVIEPHGKNRHKLKTRG